MSLVTQTYPPPTEGVSQQPDDRRRNNQVEDLVNAVCDPIRGLQKRPPTVFLKSSPSIHTGSFENAHVINRSDDEQYIVTFHNSTDAPIRVFDFDGKEYTINYDDGLRTAAIQYFLEGRTDAKPPNKYIKAVTIADYTIICNPNVTTELTDDISPKLVPQALTFTRGSMMTPCAYSITAKRSTGDISLANMSVGYVGWWTTNTSLAALYFGQSAGKASIYASLTGTRPGNHYVMGNYAAGMAVINRLTDDEIIAVSCNNGGSSFKCINNEVASIDDLPNLAPDGYKVRVRSYDGGELADFWLRWDGTKSNWVETIAPEMQYKINAQTMPWGLIRQADGTFLITTIDWGERKTGDDDSNPIPSFIDNTINNIFFYRNRLGFISGENVILSEASEFFNFWYDSAVDILATDPIDESVPSTSVMRLRHAIPMETDIVLFANDAEYLMRAEGVLSPTNIAVDFLSSYAYDVNVNPINIGNDVYFVNRGGSYSSLYRYTTLTDSYYQKYGDDVSQHVPYYIPNNVRQMIGNTGENFVALLTDDEDELNSIYIYKYIVGEDRQFRQQAWSKWKFNDYYKVVFITYINNYLYIQFQVVDSFEGGGTIYEWHRLEFGGNALDLELEKEIEYHRVYADRKMAFTIDDYNSTYDEVTDTTTVNLWQAYPSVVEGDYWIIASAIEEEIIDVPIESIKIKPERYYMYEGNGQILSATLSPDNTTNTRVVWSVSDTNIATIISNGTDAFLTAHTVGEVEVKCASASNPMTIFDTVVIEVEEPFVETELIQIILDKNTSNFGLRDYLLGIGYTSSQIDTLPFDVTITVMADKIISSDTVGIPAISMTNLSRASIVKINNHGIISGRGGDGGQATDSDENEVNGSSNGSNGGTAIGAVGRFSLIVNNVGTIMGGGGGGGSLSINWYSTIQDRFYQLQSAGGGGILGGIAGSTMSFQPTDMHGGLWTPAGSGAEGGTGLGGLVFAVDANGAGTEFSIYGGDGGGFGEDGTSPRSDNPEINQLIFTSGGNAGNAIVANSSIDLSIDGDGAIGTIVRN